MDVNECIIKILESVGVDHVFGSSGQVNGSMLLSLKDSSHIKTIIVRNEQAASFMACGYSMFSDKLGVCFATGGPGAFNIFSGLAVAYYDSLPVLAITGYTSKSMRGKGALNESSGQNRTPDSHRMFSATTKKAYILEKANHVCDVLEEAINIAMGDRPGPVHIHVPKNITTTKVKNFHPINLNIKKVLPDKKKISEFASFLCKAFTNNEDGLILIGYGCIRSHAEKELLYFINKYQIPFVTTMDAKGILPEDHPLSLGVFGTSGDPGALSYFNKAQYVLALGNSFAQNATFGFKQDFFNGKILLHINIDPGEINKVYKTDYMLVSDIKPAIQQITEELAGIFKYSVKIRSLDKDKYFDRKINYSGTKIHPGKMVKLISKNLPAGSFVMGDAGAHMIWLNCYLKLNKNQYFQNPGSFGPMASHVNGSIGVKCAHPNKTVICGCGDGSYLMAGFELLTAVQYNIPVIWIIFNNGEFNIIKKFLINMYDRHAFMQFNNPDYVSYAHACGASGFRVDKLKDFEPVLQKALQLNRPVLIDVAVESDVYPPFALGKI